MTHPLLLLALLLPAPAVAGSVHLDGLRHRQLLPPDEPAPEQAPGPVVQERQVVLEPLEDGLRLRARWRIDTERPGWLSKELIGARWHVEELRLDGLTAVSHRKGRRLIGLVEGPHSVELVAVLPDWKPGGGIPLRLLGATRGRLSLSDDALELFANGPGTVARGAVYLTGADDLALRIERPLDPERREQTLVRAQVGLGLTLYEDEVAGRARLSWQVLRGSVDRVAFSAEGIGAALELTGDNVRSFTRRGSLVEVQLLEPTEGRVDLTLSWRDALPGGVEAQLALPSLVPEAFRVEGSLQLARAGDREVIPSLSAVQPIPAGELPSFGEGLIEGTPTAAFLGQGQGSLSLLAFEPVAGPAVVVDVAQYTVATSSEGRVLMRALYEVRNERAQWLELRPPPGMRVLAARVGADTAIPVAGDDGAWRLPLLRSVETVEGLLTFPVEVALIGEVAPFGGREERELALPTVDAEVAVSRVVLHLPPNYRSRLREDEAGSVADFTAGQSLSYGFGVGETGAAQADALFQQAVSGWMSNEFDTAQEALDQLRDLGADTENVRRLQSNLDLVGGRYSGDADATMTRRIKDQARARSLEDERRAEELRRGAEEAQNIGDYDESNAMLEEYLELNERLQKLEQDESVEYAAAEEKARASYASNMVLDKQRKRAQKAAKRDATVIDFSADEISGALVQADGDTLFVVEATEEEAPQLLTKSLIAQIPAGRSYPETSEHAPLQLANEESDPLADAFGDQDGRDLVGEMLGETSGSFGGGAAPPPPPPSEPEPMPELEEVDGWDEEESFVVEESRGAVSVVDLISGTSRRSRKKSSGKDRAARAVAAQAPLPPPDTIELFTEEPDVPEVTAASMSIVVPELGGDTVRYQQLLLPAGEPHTVLIRARKNRRNP